MAAPTFGAQMAAIFGFVIMTTLLGPAVSMASSPSFSAQYFGVNGLSNLTMANLQTTFISPIISTANSTTGFGAAGQLLNSNFSPLAFIYGGIGLFWKSVTNLPTTFYIIFMGLSSDIVFLPVAIAEIISILALQYMLVGDFFKVLSMWQKSDAENVGS